MSEEQPRSYEISIEIDAPPNEVWKAIAEADGIARWFAPDVKVEPGEGGSIFVSWGPGMEGTYKIETWVANEHLCLTEYRATPFAGGAEAPEQGPQATPRRIAVDYYLEAKDGGKTVLRLVHSGFGNTEGWDAELESTKRGWPTFFRVMKHGIEMHPGEPAKPLTLMIPSPNRAAEAWVRLQSALTVGTDGRYEFRPGGEMMHGKVLLNDERAFAGVIENWNNALVSMVCEPAPDAASSMLFFMLTLYGPAIGQADAIRSASLEALTSLLG
jgi:uncharacterized protein YndB with AHSA1/START domain